MKLITKWFTMFTLLLVACVTSVYAQEEEKVYATFENPTGITWDAENMTFSWTSQYGNQLHNIGLPNGNITAYEKLVIDCEILSGDGYRFMFYAATKGTTAGGLTIITESGKHEYKLSEFDMDADYLTQCSEICLSGYNASGQVKVNEVYLVKSADPLAGAKELLTNAITVGKMKSALGKTPESFAALTQAISDGEAALVDAEATAESLATAKGDIEAAIEGLQMQAGYSVLTAGMFKHYASIEEPGEGSAVSGAFELCKASDLPFGDGNVSELNWADLTDYDKLIVITSGETKPRFCMNRLVANGQQAETQEDSKMLDINPNNDYTWSTDAYQTIEGNIYEIDLKKIVDDYTFARLHCIKKQGWGAGVIVTEIILYKEEDVPAATVLALTAAAGAYPTGNNFVNTWTSNTEPVVTVTASANNMDRRVTEHFAWYSGQAQSSTYTFRVPGGLMITAISLKAKANSNEQTVTIGETQQVFTTDEAKMEVSGLASAAVALTLTGSNTSLLISQIDVTVAEDPNYVPPIASVEELTNSKAYSLVVPRGALGVNAEKLVATNVAGNEASNFALISYNDKLYLYSIAANAFIAKDGKLTSSAPCAITLKALGESRFQFFLGDNCLNVSGSSVLIDSWTTVDDGNKFFITPVEDYDASNALATLESIFANTVVYEISDANGVVFTSEAAPATLGAEITELPADLQRAFCSYDVPHTIIAAGENIVKVTVSYSMPFTLSSDFDNATWYYATIRGNKYLRADDSAKDASNRYQTSSTNGGGNEYKWAFGGNPYTGLIIMNRGIGAEKVLYMGAQPEFQALNAEDIKCFWTVVANGDGFNVRSLTGATMYINDNGNGGNIGTWNSTNGATDTGGRWNISAVPEYEISIAEGLENGNIITSRATYQANDEVQLNIQPAEGYRLKTLTVMAGENEVAVADDNTFVMPAANVTISATFDGKIYIETDLTSQFPIDFEGWAGATGYVGWAAPQVTTNDGRVTPACERFDGGVATTGTVFKRTLSGLGNGTYRIELYGAAASTKGRDTGIDSEMTSADEGDETAVYLYATTASGTVKQYIPAHWATDFNGSGIATAVLNDVVVTDGTVEIGMFGDKKFTNWHVIQIKGVTATVDADYALAPHVAAVRAIEESTVPAALYTDIEGALNDYDNKFDTEKDYLDAIEALDAIAAKAKAYVPLTEVLAKGADYKAHVAEGNEAIATYEAAVADVQAAYDAVTVEDFAAAINTVNAALPALGKAQTKAGADMTLFAENLAWTCPQGNGPGNYQGCTETYTDGSYTTGKVMYQKVEGLPAGFYKVEFIAVANHARGASAFGENIAQVYANDATENITVEDQAACTPTDYVRTLTTFVKDGVLEYGLQNIADGGNWYVAKLNAITLVEPANPAPTNLDFAETEAIDNAVTTYAKDMAKNSTTYFGAQAVDSWTALNLSDNLAPETGDSRGELDQRAGAVVAYGSTAWLGGSANVAPAAGPEGSNGKGLGMVAVWTATVQYTQPVTLDAGTYTLEIPVYNSVGGTTVPAKSLIGFIASDGTEYLAPAKAYAVNTWTTETVTFTLDKTTNGVFSLGYTMTNNGNGNAPHLFFDCVNIITDQREALRTELKAALSVAQATIEAKANVGDKLFQKPEAAFEVFNRSVIAQQAVAENAEATLEQLQDALTALAEASTTYAAAINAPAADKAYVISNNTAEGNLSIHDGTVTIEEGAKVFFTAVEGGYALSNEDGKYVFKTTANSWTLATTENLNEAYVINANLVEGGYTLQGANGLMGTDNTTAGSAVYANKTAANNGVWTIEEWALPAVVYTVNIADHQNGTVEADKTTAAEGETVTVTVTPAEGYMVDEAYWTVGEEKHEFEEPEEGNKASFVMPAADVTITVTFKAIKIGVDYAGVIEQTLINRQTSEQAGETTTSDKTLTLIDAGEGAVNIKVNDGIITPIGMPIPEFTIEGVTVEEAKDGSATYSYEGTVSVTNGMIPVTYEVTLTGYQASAEATPVFCIILTQAVIDTIYFGADADAIAAYKQAVGIKNVKSVQNAGTIYDLSGRKVEKVQRGGIYIINGKKVSMK